MNRIFNRLLNVEGTVVEDARIVDSPLRPEPVLEVRVRPRKGMPRCPRCGKRRHGYDQGGGTRRPTKTAEAPQSSIPLQRSHHGIRTPTRVCVHDSSNEPYPPLDGRLQYRDAMR